MLEKPKLFVEAKEFWWALSLFVILLGGRLGWLYYEYTAFVHKPFYFTQVEVVQAYEKQQDKHHYTVLRVDSPSLGITFFTRTYRKVHSDWQDLSLRLKLYPSPRVSFWEYCSTSFIRSKIVGVKPKPPRGQDRLAQGIARQHEHALLGEFYQAIFLAIPLSKDLREIISSLGVSHLVALSGFHLGILSGVLFFLIRPIYRHFQQRYFPYRFDLIDIGVVVLLLLGWYLYFVGMPASLLRSYVMMLLGWGVLIVGIELLSFDFLWITMMMILLIFPKLLFSLSFWFSILGVFYIFLLLFYFKGLSKWTMTWILSFGLFILMMPLVHMVFPLSTSTQLYAPLLSLLFSLFYPLSLGLHLIGWGNLLDGMLLRLFAVGSQSIEVHLPWMWGVGYLLLSLVAPYDRRLFYGLFGVALGFVGWIFIRLML